LTFKELYNTFGIGEFNKHRRIYQDVLKQHSQQQTKQLRNPKEGHHAFVERSISGRRAYILFLVFVLRIGSRIPQLKPRWKNN
jgi:hypothetical protein